MKLPVVEGISVTVRERVAEVVLDRPDELNAMTHAMMDGLPEVLHALSADAGVRCVILTGRGRAFCAGGDLSTVGDDGFTDGGLVARMDRRHGAAELLHAMPKPTLARLNGVAAGAGLSLALACDVRIAGASAKLVSAFAQVGFSGDYGGTWTLQRLVGTERARKGIGKEVALALAKNGADVALNGRRPGPVEEVLAQVQALGRHAGEADGGEGHRPHGPDRRARGERRIARQGARKLLPRDSARVVSRLRKRAVAEHTLLFFRAVAAHMVERNGGKVIFFGTDAGRWPTPGVCLPGGSGAALVMSTKVLAQEFARHPIRINTISTTVTENTPGLSDVLVARAASKVFEKAMKRQPFKVRSEDLASAALYLASEESNAITGQTLSVNGGLCFPG